MPGFDPDSKRSGDVVRSPSRDHAERNARPGQALGDLSDRPIAPRYDDEIARPREGRIEIAPVERGQLPTELFDGLDELRGLPDSPVARLRVVYQRCPHGLGICS